MEQFVPFPIEGQTPERQLLAHRLNCLGSLFYFVKLGLRRKKVTNLHKQLCSMLEAEHIKHVIEWPRDHYKTTCASEGRSMWGALPFNNKDEDEFRKAGYSPEYVRWMKKVHDPYSRTLIVAENITNASKIGLRLRKHYESNAVYRSLFPETLPDSTCIWGSTSLHIKRPAGRNQLDFSPNGEGTFDFLGVGGALQSRHYTFLVQDDLFGRKALESIVIAEKTNEYHQLLVGAFDSDDPNHENDELVIGNRWGFHDLNSFIREHETVDDQGKAWFNITSHSAIGGCCDLHPPGVPIFPEQFSFEKLDRLRQRLGTYFYSCQYLNNPAAPENADFQPAWLQYFRLKLDSRANHMSEWVCEYEVRDGIVQPDKHTRKLSLTLVVDPMHSGNAGQGRCRHAIVVAGVDREANFHIIEAWASQCSYDTFYDKIFELAEKWKIRRIGFESVAAQKFAIHHIETMNKFKPWKLEVVPLKGEVETPDGEISKKKVWRIYNVIAPLAERGALYTQRKLADFNAEFTTFSTVAGKQGKFLDLLDAFAYAPQMLRIPTSSEQHKASLRFNQQQLANVNRPYSMSLTKGGIYAPGVN